MSPKKILKGGGGHYSQFSGSHRSAWSLYIPRTRHRNSLQTSRGQKFRSSRMENKGPDKVSESLSSQDWYEPFPISTGPKMFGSIRKECLKGHQGNHSLCSRARPCIVCIHWHALNKERVIYRLGNGNALASKEMKRVHLFVCFRKDTAVPDAPHHLAFTFILCIAEPRRYTFVLSLRQSFIRRQIRTIWDTLETCERG